MCGSAQYLEAGLLLEGLGSHRRSGCKAQLLQELQRARLRAGHQCSLWASVQHISTTAQQFVLTRHHSRAGQVPSIT